MTNDMNNAVAVESLSLLEVVRALWKNILVIALVAVLVGAAAFGYTTLMISPEYQATAAMYVNNSSFSLGDTSFSISSGEISASNSLVSIYVYILKSRTTLEEVIKDAELEYSPTTLKGMISTRGVSGTSAFEVTVTSKNPSEAELIANTIAKVLPDRISELVDGSSVRIVDYAIIPAKRSGPNLLRNTGWGILVGALISAAIVVLRFLMDDKSKVLLQTADDVRLLYPEIMILAQVPDMRQSEKSGYYSSYYYSDTKTKKEAGSNGRKQR